MSQYENYEEVSQLYDEARVADGVPSMVAMISALLGKDFHEVTMLEAGCGTGNYSRAFFQHGLRKLTMIDASEGMLQKAKLKLKDYQSLFEMHLMTLPRLTFSDCLFDVVCFIQVLHHLDAPDPKKTLDVQDYPLLVASIKESYRLLKPNGVLLIDTIFEENVDSFWWTSLCPKSAELMRRVRIRKEALIKLLEESGFNNFHLVSRPGSCLLKKEIYDDFEKISDEQWRGYLSCNRHLVDTDELNGLCKLIESEKSKGTLEQFKIKQNKKSLLLRTTYNSLCTEKYL